MEESTTTSSLFFLESAYRFDQVGDLIDFYHNHNMPVGDNEGTKKLKRGIPRPEWQLANSQITIGERLGEGAFGEVFKGILELDSNLHFNCFIKVNLL